MDKETLSLLDEELTRLLIKSSMVEPSDKPTLICSVWTKKSYNLDNFERR